MASSADLHVHTYFSDSSSSPQEVVDDALKAGLETHPLVVEAKEVLGAKLVDVKLPTT